MSTAAPCYNCGGNVADTTGMNQIKKLERLIADNYTVIVICIILSIVLFICLKYFGTQIYEVIQRYRKSAIQVKSGLPDVTEDTEIYDEDDKPYDISKYFGQGKNDFVKSMEDAYKDYNKLKSDYIRTTYSKTNDDVIDKDTVFYGKYDDYDYPNPKKEKVTS